ncbi:type II toxin-antitoxin system VapC family toxin [Belnapia moabensis]|uniref:type II toxin-antitoxin system VapC family toxin n=1 Tax=Belnapia moabensis TaxID=365533 RepID=UPI0005B7C67E|nr:type II toxin-antitoxin system VapC family toxin [Belnapia moabensis]
MRLLIDTHIFIWAVTWPDRLQPRLHEAILAPRNTILVSAASVWEIAIKRSLRRLTFPLERLDAVLEEAGFRHLPITASHAIEVGGLPRHHTDPFDRMLVAQACVDDLLLASDDPLMAAYAVRLFERDGGE